MVLPGVAKSALLDALLLCRRLTKLRIGCGPSCQPTHNLSFHTALEALCGRKEAGAPSGPSGACAG